MDFHSKASNLDTLAFPWCVENRLSNCEEEIEASQQSGKSLNKMGSAPLDLNIRSNSKR